MAEIQVTDNTDILPPIAFDIGSDVKIFFDDVNNWWILRDATTNDPIEIAPGIQARFPAEWPPP